MPNTDLGLLKQLAERKGLSGWCVTLDYPSYLAVMTYATNRALRHEVYKAFTTRASEKADNTAFDNTENIQKIRQLRHERS